MKEEWRLIAIAPDYEVSNLGRVRSYKGLEPRILRPCAEHARATAPSNWSPPKAPVRRAPIPHPA